MSDPVPCWLATPDGSVTLLFTDIVDSTALYRLEPPQWLDVFRRHRDLVTSHIHEHGGAVVKSLGDGFMAAFAARLLDEAGPGEVLVSPSVRLAAGGSSVRFGPSREASLKGFGRCILYPVIWIEDGCTGYEEPHDGANGNGPARPPVAHPRPRRRPFAPRNHR